MEKTNKEKGYNELLLRFMCVRFLSFGNFVLHFREDAVTVSGGSLTLLIQMNKKQIRNHKMPLQTNA